MISLILSGGVGTRLWPLSREKLPKQFSPLLGESLFVHTVERLSQFGEVQVCTSEKMKTLTEMALQKSNGGFHLSQAYYEPVGRNTAPAIALVCRHMLSLGRDDEVMGVFPSDHWIEKTDVFAQAIHLAQDCAKQGQIVTIGLQPTYPATGFGYIECETKKAFAQGEELSAFTVKGFKEKPDEEKAHQYIQSGNFFWNSGMFVFQISTMIEAMEKFMPEMWQKLLQVKADLSNLSQVYQDLESESIDYGIMEKVSNQVNIPCDIGWSDLGSWDDVAEISQRKSLQSQVEMQNIQSSDCYAFSDHHKTICFAGVDNLIVVDTKDALLVTQKGQSQIVKPLVDQLKTFKNSLLIEHQYEARPWGEYKNLYEEKNFKTKVITVDPYQQLSYQSHEKRSEIWVTVEGKGEVVLNDEVISIFPGEVVKIPQGAKHRMRNTGDEPLKFVEVQMGHYFGEDDIIRYQDDYKRV